MDLDVSSLLPAITKSAGATLALAVLIGLSYVIREWRGGTASERGRADMTKRLEDVEARLKAAEDRIEALTRTAHDLRYQRDQARVYAESLELRYGHEPVKVWPPDEEE